MPPDVAIPASYWMAFIGAVLVFLALDLGVFHRKAHEVTVKEAGCWTVLWTTLALIFGSFLAPRVIPGWDRVETVEFITGYLIELSLSMDNVFVIALIFTYFGVAKSYQHRVLFWGIIGALALRGLMIWLGAALISRFEWMLYALGAFLIFTGIKMVLAGDEELEPEKNPVVRLARRLFPISQNYDGSRFTTVVSGKRMLTPLALVLIMVETTDLIFAVDSIPAIFAITQKPFIVFTSNIFAIMGLRSLYFVLAGAIGYFKYLKAGLSLVLCFIGLKMLIAHFYKIPTVLSLVVVGGIIGCAVGLSWLAARRDSRPTQNS